MAGEFQLDVRTRLGGFKLDSAELLAPTDSGGEESFATALLRPSISLRHPFGTWRRAPHGEPEGPWLLAVVGAVLLVVVGLALYGVRCLLRR